MLEYQGYDSKEIGKEYQLKDVPAMNKEKAAMLESYVRSKLKLI